MSIPWALTIPVIIFVGVIVPLWITFHYITVWIRMRSGAKKGHIIVEPAEMEGLRQSAERLEQRLETLETILDNEAPNWRKK